MALVHLKVRSTSLSWFSDNETVDVFNAIDAAWAARDYETLKSYIVDGGNFLLLTAL